MKWKKVEKNTKKQFNVQRSIGQVWLLMARIGQISSVVDLLLSFLFAFCITNKQLWNE